MGKPRSGSGSLLAPSGDGTAARRSGALLVELLISLTFLTVGLFGFFFVFYANFKGGEETEEVDDARVALENATEQLKGYPFETLYQDFYGATIPAPGLTLPDEDGQMDADGSSITDPAEIQLTFFTDETRLPSEFGPIRDLDGDGVLQTTDCSGDYDLMPVRLSVTFQLPDGSVETRQLFVTYAGL